ncbi:DUF7344 domain-containing protein [Halomicrobium urmianum]|uniref:DUF7344 domain-containing protein n=1 Tax=Halomicrobium urmianum TaxID=1586233 RepID=UPI001CD9C4B9|nr:hypothetical protein [Halomicrobium urmianum]
MVSRPSKTTQSESDADGERRDELFDVLSSSRRRSILRSLQTAETPISVAALATELAPGESSGSRDDDSTGEETAIRASLVHTHLPKMAQTGFVRYDDSGRTVALADRTEEVRTHLQTPAASGGD